MPYPQNDRERLLKFRAKSFDMTCEKYGEWLAGYDWRAYFTGTFRKEIGPECAKKWLANFLYELQTEIRGAVACVSALEGKWSGCGRPGSRFHWHILLAAAPWLTESLLDAAKPLWEKLYGDAVLEQYEKRQSAAYYIMKQISDPNFEYELFNLERLPYLGSDDLFATSKTNPNIPDHVRDLPSAKTIVAVPFQRARTGRVQEGSSAR